MFAPPDFISAGLHSNFPSANTAGGFLPALHCLGSPVDFACGEAGLDHTSILMEVRGGVGNYGWACRNCHSCGAGSTLPGGVQQHHGCAWEGFGTAGEGKEVELTWGRLRQEQSAPQVEKD